MNFLSYVPFVIYFGFALLILFVKNKYLCVIEWHSVIEFVGKINALIAEYVVGFTDQYY